MPPPRSTSPCSGRTGGHRPASQPSPCTVWGGGSGAWGHGGWELSRQLPRCRSQVPETVSPGSTVVTLRCRDPAGMGGGLRYTLEGPPASRSRFRMEGPRLQVSETVGSAQAPREPGRMVGTLWHVLSCSGALRGSPRFPASLPAASPASQLCRAPRLWLSPPPWLRRSTPRWTTTQRPWPLWASSSQPPWW